MFKKFSVEENVVSSTQLKNSVQRGIQSQIVAQYPCLASVIDEIIPKKLMTSWKCQEHVQLIVVNHEIMFFNQRDGPFYPTLKLLHKFPNMMQKMQVDKGAIRFTSVSPMVTNLSGENSLYDEALMNVHVTGPLHILCSSLNKPFRANLFAPGREGQLLHDQLKVDGFITLKMFLDWWISEDYAENIAEFMKTEFNHTPMLLERSTAHSFRYRIPVPVAELPLADIFEKFESVKSSLCIKDYSVGQTTLEQIFNQFAGIVPIIVSVYHFTYGYMFIIASQDNPEVEAQQLHTEFLRRQITSLTV